MFSKNKLIELMSLYMLSDNYKTFDPEPLNDRLFLKKDLIEAKVQVDRWRTVTTDWVFPTSQKTNIISLFPELNDNNTIWGANVHFTDFLPEFIGIGLALTEDGCLQKNYSENIANSIVVFNVNDSKSVK